MPHPLTKLTIFAGFSVLAILAAHGLICGEYSIALGCALVATWLVTTSLIVSNKWLSATYQRRLTSVTFIVASFLALITCGSMQYEEISRTHKTCAVQLQLTESGQLKSFIDNK
ncbi:MAG: hypothetical protein K2Y22_14095 [Candidatus Obscuribacterales bacterium]|nr:hypothetical protein [Candidatus Obscuribacterales bacterium]